MKKFKKILIGADITISRALRQMDESAERILFVVDTQKRLLGAVTDGDIRRWILKGGSLNERISKAMHKKPVYLSEAYPAEEASELMISKKIECIPIIDSQRRIISAVRWTDLFGTKVKQQRRKINAPVVIIAGGEGHRLSPLTKVLPKALLPIGEQPIIGMIIDRFAEYGCKKFYLSLNHKANIIKAYFSDFKHKFKLSYIQENKPLGTAGSLHLLKDKINTSLYVINCDTLIEADYADILRFHKAKKNKITLVGAMKHYTIPYGVCEIENGGSLKNITEKPEQDLLAITGLYVLEPEILKMVPVNKFCQITDLINGCIKKGMKIGVYPISEKSWVDAGQWEELQNTLKKFGIK